MYKGQQLNRDEYLLGRSIDKNFEQLDAEEKIKADPINNPAISKPINHVEHEVIPFSIRQYKGLPGTEQVDMARKMLEDPLMLIKQKEMETRREILQNPVKLKELHKMLKEERSKKKSKKEKKSKKKHKKSRSDSDNDDVDLDKALAEKYKRLQGALAKDLDSDDDVNAGNVDKLLSLKFEALSKELDKMTGTKKKSKKKKRDSSSSSDDFHVAKKKEMPEPKRNRSRSPQRKDERERFNDRRRRTPEYARRRPDSPMKRTFPRDDNRRYRSPDRYRNDRRNRNPSPRRRSRSHDDRNTSRYQQRQKRSRTKSIERSQRNRFPERRERCSRTPEKRQKSPPEPQPNRNRSPSSSTSSSSDSSPDRQNDDSDEDRPTKKTFGLVTSDGKGISIKKSAPKRKSSSPRREKPSKSVVSSKQEPKSKPTRMTQAEIDARLKEMMSNASWREKERSEKVNKYRENEKREQEDAKKDFDKDFLTRQLKKTANSTMSVESRIKSNLNNIQRSSRTMESNFARR